MYSLTIVIKDAFIERSKFNIKLKSIAIFKKLYMDHKTACFNYKISDLSSFRNKKLSYVDLKQ